MHNHAHFSHLKLVHGAFAIDDRVHQDTRRVTKAYLLREHINQETVHCTSIRTNIVTAT